VSAAPGLPWRNTGLHRDLATVPEVLDRSLGLYSTQPTGHLELLARIDGYRLGDLTQVVEQDRSAVRLRALRGSGFVLPTDVLPVVQAATRRRNLRNIRSLVRGLVTPYEVWADRIEEVVGDEDLAPREIRARLRDPGDDADLLRYVVNLMAYENRLVAARVTGSWRSDRTTYARWDAWLPDVDVWSLDEADAVPELARLYLDRHGPATADDLAFWSGLTRTDARRAVGAVATPVAGHDGWWATTPVTEHDPPPVRLLPIWDAVWVTYRDRTRLVDETRYPYVYDGSGNATSVVLVGGRAAGIWDLGKDDRQLEVKVAPLGADWQADTWDAIADEADRIGTLVGAKTVSLVRCSDPPDLTTAPRNRFMSPLKEHRT
jgi:hypothetical protein